ncbi:MAG TPA: hypothetical protein VMB34_15700 [Acetobacteraceae bacterium]|nr:hypothetical protein [Acetobacteraceae bacterium]
MPDAIIRACVLDLQPGEEPVECVLDWRRPDMCLHADSLRRREQCRWWREPEADAGGSNHARDCAPQRHAQPHAPGILWPGGKGG